MAIGATLQSLDDVIQSAADAGASFTYHRSSNILGSRFRNDLLAICPRLRLTTFGGHDEFCRRLHEELHNVLHIDVTPEYCATSRELKESPTLYASHFDCLSLLPLSVKHSVMLDFGKWLTLGPDRCSILLFAANDELHKFAAGSMPPEIPPDVARLVDGAA